MKELVPNFTQIPNIILDDFLSLLNGSEIKVLLYICRRTYGFQKNSDSISISQICSGIKTKDGNVLDSGTGLSNKPVIEALKKLEEYGLIKSEKVNGNTTKYYINTTYVKNTPVYKVHTSCVETTQVPMYFLHTQKKEKESIQKKDIAKDKPLHEKVPEIIKAFEIINPACKRMYGNKTQRQACHDLIETYGFETVMNFIENVLPVTNTKLFWKATTPSQLWNNWSNINNEVGEKINKQKEKNNVVIF
jgi:predicted transcriptional regulator